MEQFAKAKSEFDQMPPWMKESAKVATLTYPQGVLVEPKAPTLEPIKSPD
jgi:hypothetical protein